MDNNNKKPDLSFVWNILDTVLRDTFKKNEIGDVILPFVVLRRLDCMLAPFNKKVREQYDKFHEKLTEDKLKPVLRKAAGGLKFYNTSRHTFKTLKDDAANITINFTNYLNGFNEEVRDIFTHFEFDKVIARLNRNKLLFALVQEFEGLDFSLSVMDNHDMGYVFEEILRIANDFSNETAGEHFTPRDVIRLINAILFTPDKDTLSGGNVIRSIYDPTCGTGGMVNLGRKYILEELCVDGIKPTVNTFGQELNEMSYAIAKSEALVTDGDADNIRLGNTLTDDQFKGKYFDYIMANPPYGVTWKKDQDAILKESQDPEGRFYAGTPRTSDGQLLFIQHMISKMKKDGTSRMAVVTNGSPLFSGGAGSGESYIRKWIIESDLLECIVALPKDLFYNTGINTYIWFLTNNKSAERRGKVQLIDATSFCTSAAKSLGNKRNDIRQQDIDEVLKIYLAFEEGEHCKIYPNQFFGNYQLVVEQPLRDENGNVVMKAGKKVADTSKRDTESVPLDIQNVHEYFKTEVLPHIDPESWLELSKTRVNYEINFTRYFYQYEQPESSAAIAERIKVSEEKALSLFHSLISEFGAKDYDVPMKNSTIDWVANIPESWDVMRFKHFMELITEPAKDGRKIGLENIESGTSKYIETESEFEGSGIAFKKNDIVYGKLRPYLRKVWQADFNGNAVGDFFVFRNKKNSIAKYLKYLLLSEGFTSIATGSTEGAKMPRVSSQFILSLETALPPIKEQEQIASYLDSQTSKIDTLISELKSQIEDLKSYKQSLITEAVTGQVDVRDWTPNE